MTTTFEIVIAGETDRYARQASYAAFDEIDRIESFLSRFIESSDVSRINRNGADQPVHVSIETFECMQMAARIARETSGAFDVTLVPDGMKRVTFDETQVTIAFGNAGVPIDLGGIGKGFAIDKVSDVLREWSIESALVHSGSSALAMGTPPGENGWRISAGSPDKKDPEHLVLCNSSLSASGTAVKGAHIIDPRTGRPADGPIRVWVSCSSCAVSDALSTAFMVMQPAEVKQYCNVHPDIWAMLLTEHAGQQQLTCFGKR